VLRKATVNQNAAGPCRPVQQNPECETRDRQYPNPHRAFSGPAPTNKESQSSRNYDAQEPGPCFYRRNRTCAANLRPNRRRDHCRPEERDGKVQQKRAHRAEERPDRRVPKTRSLRLDHNRSRRNGEVSAVELVGKDVARFFDKRVGTSR
jgi:hypothetical protein